MKGKLVSLIAGPTDKTKLFRFGNISSEKYQSFIDERAKVLARNLSQINIIPDDGVPLDIAKAYKNFGGENVIGYIPKGGITALEQYFQYCDRIEEFDLGWSGLNTCLSLKGDVVTVFGLSPGTLVEVAYTKYHKKYLSKVVPVIIDRTTIDGNMPPELTDEIDMKHFSTNDELEKILEEYKK
ncbi:MAG: hypothetical protein HC945_02915 [Nitrosarchaeum sp.]|nr:hypothetical protein [Nitrosarchaeum sp.]